MVPGVKHALLFALCTLCLACSGSHGSAREPTPPAAAKDFSATRWIPAKPTYAVGARSVRDAQRTLRDLVESFGMLVDLDLQDVAGELAATLAVDALSPDALAAIGIDLDGGLAMFSEAVNPTFVVHLQSPDQMRGFLEQLRGRPDFKVQTQIVDGIEIATAPLRHKMSLAWAVAGDWMWLHVGIEKDDGTTWFTASRHPGDPAWANDWQWAASGKTGKPAVVGIANMRALLGRLVAKVPSAAPCARLGEDVARVAIAITGDDKHAGGRVSIDLGPAAASVARAVRPPPDGFAAVASRAALAVQVNVDLFAVRNWVGPCLALARADLLSVLDTYGVRAGRALVLSFDPDTLSGSTGAVSLDLTTKKYFASLLDQIPLRSTLEKKRTFGPYGGKSLSVPFGPSVDYVLTDSVALAALGDGVLASVVGKGPAAGGPLLALDVQPPVLSKAAWESALALVRAPRPAWIAEHLVRWRDGHVAVSLDGTHLVIEASGNRR
jgi:hypothetical protein